MNDEQIRNLLEGLPDIDELESVEVDDDSSLAVTTSIAQNLLTPSVSSLQPADPLEEAEDLSWNDLSSLLVQSESELEPPQNPVDERVEHPMIILPTIGIEDDSELDEAPVPFRDPLSARRVQGDSELRRFTRELIRTATHLRLLRFLIASPLDAISVEELEEVLVEDKSLLDAALRELEVTGLVMVSEGKWSINPRARELKRLSSLIARWQSPRTRPLVWSWLQ